MYKHTIMYITKKNQTMQKKKQQKTILVPKIQSQFHYMFRLAFELQLRNLKTLSKKGRYTLTNIKKRGF